MLRQLLIAPGFLRPDSLWHCVRINCCLYARRQIVPSENVQEDTVRYVSCYFARSGDRFCWVFRFLHGPQNACVQRFFR